MRPPFRTWLAGTAGLGAFALSFALFAQDSGQQTRSNDRDPQQRSEGQAGQNQDRDQQQRPEGQPGQGQAGRARDQRDGQQVGQVQGGQHDAESMDRIMLISHGLSMAIEGSSLQALAQQGGAHAGAAGAQGAGGIAGGGRDAGAQGVTGREPGTAGATDRQAGAGRAGAIDDGRREAGAQGAGGIAGGGRDAGAQGGMAASELQRHARKALQDSEDLLGQAGQGQQQGDRDGHQGGGSAVDRFYSAANDYAMTLRRLGDLGGAAAAAGGAGNMMAGTDMQSVAVLNHAVKEALDAYKIRQAISMTGRSEGQAIRALQRHAEEMDREGRQAIQMFAAHGGQGQGRTGAGTGAAVGTDRDRTADPAVRAAGTPAQAQPRVNNPTVENPPQPTPEQLREIREVKEEGATTIRDQIRASRSDADIVEVSPPVRPDPGPQGAAGTRIGTEGQAAGGRAGAGAGQGGAVAMLAQRAQDIVDALDALEGRGGDRGQGDVQQQGQGQNQGRSDSGDSR